MNDVITLIIHNKQRTHVADKIGKTFKDTLSLINCLLFQYTFNTQIVVDDNNDGKY